MPVPVGVGLGRLVPVPTGAGAAERPQETLHNFNRVEKFGLKPIFFSPVESFGLNLEWVTTGLIQPEITPTRFKSTTLYRESKGLNADQKCVRLINFSHFYQIFTFMTLIWTFGPQSVRLAAEELAGRLTSLVSK